MKIVIVALVLALSLISAEQIYDGITIRSIERNIDLSSQFAHHNSKITYYNSGSKTVSDVYLTIQDEGNHLALLEVFDESGAKLAATKIENGEVEQDGKKLRQGFTCHTVILDIILQHHPIFVFICLNFSIFSYKLYKVDLGKTLAPQASVVLETKAIFTHVLIPYPKEITQFERQLVKYNDNIFYFAPYTVQTQTTNVKLASNVIESKTEKEPTEVKVFNAFNRPNSSA
jgi:hypothetical protein